MSSLEAMKFADQVMLPPEADSGRNDLSVSRP